MTRAPRSIRTRPRPTRPSGATTAVEVPHITGGDNRESSNTKEAQRHPAGRARAQPVRGHRPRRLHATPSSAREKRAPVACPAASKVGTVLIETPPLPSGSLTGSVFVGQQLSRDPASGNLYRIFVDAESARYGISVRLVGHVSADPATGQLTTRFTELPQVPFTQVLLQLDGGPKATLTSPAICGPHTTMATMTPWSGNPAKKPTAKFTLTEAPGGGKCAKTLAERPFAPGFTAAAANPRGGAYTSLKVGATRVPGNQELKGVDVKLPPGLTAKLAGRPLLPGGRDRRRGRQHRRG